MTRHTGDLERRFREGKGQRRLTSDPTRTRCQGCSKLKLRKARLERGDPDLDCDDVWPEAQCSKGALEGAYGCRRHAGKSAAQIQSGMVDIVPVDLAERLQMFHRNSDEILNRTHEIALHLARKAELLESLDDLVLGEEAWLAVKEAVALIRSQDYNEALSILEIALADTRKEKEVWDEARKIDDLIGRMTTIHFTVMEKLQAMMTIDQTRAMLEGFFIGSEKILIARIKDADLRAELMAEFGMMVRGLTTLRQGELLGDGIRPANSA